MQTGHYRLVTYSGINCRPTVLRTLQRLTLASLQSYKLCRGALNQKKVHLLAQFPTLRSPHHTYEIFRRPVQLYDDCFAGCIQVKLWKLFKRHLIWHTTWVHTWGIHCESTCTAPSYWRNGKVHLQRIENTFALGIHCGALHPVRWCVVSGICSHVLNVMSALRW